MYKILITTFTIMLLGGAMVSCGGDDDNSENAPVNPLEPNNGSNNNNNESNDSPPKGVEAVDLGLSVKWASMNVGATSKEDHGDLYSWGETSTKTTYTKANYQFYHTGYIDKDGVKIDSAYYERIGKDVYLEIDGKQYVTFDIAGTVYDVAHIKWGGKWRLPTYKELKELKDNCVWKWASINDFYGYKVTGKNGNYIFIPAAGYGGTEGKDNSNKEGNYVSSTLPNKISPYSFEWGYVYGIDFDASEIYLGEHGRIWGFSVRPVSD